MSLPDWILNWYGAEAQKQASEEEQNEYLAKLARQQSQVYYPQQQSNTGGTSSNQQNTTIDNTADFLEELKDALKESYSRGSAGAIWQTGATTTIPSRYPPGQYLSYESLVEKYEDEETMWREYWIGTMDSSDREAIDKCYYDSDKVMRFVMMPLMNEMMSRMIEMGKKVDKLAEMGRDGDDEEG